jgi:Putative prokaryotic signal transducing protein
MAEPDPEEEQALVFTAPTASEGYAVKALLESEGIQVFVKGEAEGPYRFGPLDLWVRAADAELARRSIESARSDAATDGDGQTG